jgi:hypothetical protein
VARHSSAGGRFDRVLLVGRRHISLELTAGGYDELTFANVNDHVELKDASATYTCDAATSAAATSTP